jgi:uncharacterized protein
MTSHVDLRSTDDGVLLPVRVVPRASRTEIDGLHNGAIRVRLKAPPVEGAANRELCGYIAKCVGVSRGNVEIASGHRGRTKTLLIRGLSAQQVLSRLTRS